MLVNVGTYSRHGAYGLWSLNTLRTGKWTMAHLAELAKFKMGTFHSYMLVYQRVTILNPLCLLGPSDLVSQVPVIGF